MMMMMMMMMMKMKMKMKMMIRKMMMMKMMMMMMNKGLRSYRAMCLGRGWSPRRNPRLLPRRSSVPKLLSRPLPKAAAKTPVAPARGARGKKSRDEAMAELHSNAALRSSTNEALSRKGTDVLNNLAFLGQATRLPGMLTTSCTPPHHAVFRVGASPAVASMFGTPKTVPAAVSTAVRIILVTSF